MHPGARILVAILSALALPGLSFFYLAVSSAVLVLFALAAPARLWQALRRSRWLLLGIVLVYAFQVPGPALLDAWPWGPSRPGLDAGLLQAWRLAAMLLLIDLLILRLPAEALLAGLVAVLWPLRVFGLPVERVAVRLGLTLHALASPGSRGLPTLSLAAVEATASALPDSLAIRHLPWRAADSAGVLVAFALVVGLWQTA